MGACARVARVLPLSNWMRLSVALMIVHQFVAFALYVTPLIFMFERIWGSHNARWYIRLPLRLPVGGRPTRVHPLLRCYLTAPLRPWVALMK